MEKEKLRDDYLKLIDQVIALGPFNDSWASLTEYCIPAWYENAKFGIFIHWGVFSVPGFGNEWYAHYMYQEGTEIFKHHLETYGSQNKFGYKDFIPLFKAEKFDPHVWIDLFIKAGARYVIPVAELHDGFQMYASNLCQWNAVKMGPKRDIIGELATAARQRGLHFGVSSHRAENYWFYSGGMKFDSDVRYSKYQDLYGPAQDIPEEKRWTIEGPQPNQAFLDDWLIRCIELVEKYKPEIIWLDTWIQKAAFRPYLKRFAAYYYNRAKQWGIEPVINYKYESFPEGTAVLDLERENLSAIRPMVWQTDTTMSKKCWGYIKDNVYRNVDEVIFCLVDAISKNGTMLLNVGPQPDGIIPLEEQGILLQIGEWFKINGEAVYGTRPWKIYGEGKGEIEANPIGATRENDFSSEDIRFTSNGDALYAFVLKWPESNLVNIRSLGKSDANGKVEVKGVHLLGSTALPKWEQSDYGLRVDLTGCQPVKLAFTLKIRIL